jgi:hypothetical protein
MYTIFAFTCGRWHAFKAFEGRAAARREALRLAYDCGFTWDKVRVVK